MRHMNGNWNPSWTCFNVNNVVVFSKNVWTVFFSSLFCMAPTIGEKDAAQDGDQTVSVEEFTEGCLKLHGPARSVDLYSLRQQKPGAPFSCRARGLFFFLGDFPGWFFWVVCLGEFFGVSFSG